MPKSIRGCAFRSLKKALIMSVMIIPIMSTNSFGQDKGDYFVGMDQNLEMIVHIMGEVQKPGEYRVTDNTNILELLAKAGGPTQYSNLNGVKITRLENTLLASRGDSTMISLPRQKTTKIKLSKYLDDNQSNLIPKLHPGDIVFVPRNKWHVWRSAATVIRDVSVIVSAYLLYLRSTK